MEDKELITIKELKYKIKEIEDDLELYLKLKQIEFTKTQPQGTSYENERVNGKFVFDKFTHYMIKSEKYDSKITELLDSLLVYEKRLNKKIKNICNADSKAFITYLREEEKYSWEKISRITSYSERQARRIYKENA